MKELQWMLGCCWIWSTICWTGVDLTSNESFWKKTGNSVITNCSTDEMAKIYASYFRYHGVWSVIIVICPEDVATLQQKRDLRALLVQFGQCGFYVRIFNAFRYTEENFFDMQSNQSLHQVDITNQTALFTFEKLVHKSGVLLFQLGSNFALELLAWSARPANNYFTPGHFWLLIAQDFSEIRLLGDERIFLPPDSEVRVALRTPPSTEVTILDIYKSAAIKPLEHRIVGSRMKNADYMLYQLNRFGSAISYRTNLEGITFNTGIVITLPDLYTDIEDLSLRNIDTIAKVHHRITSQLKTCFNVSFNNRQTDNYGERQANGSFDGLMGRFERSEVDFALNAFLMRADHVDTVDFISETYRLRAGLMFRQPSLSAVANIFALPFGTDVWISILLLMIITVLVLSIQLVYSPHLLDMDVLDCVLFVWGAMCQQGFYVTLYNRSTRITVFTTFVATLFLFTSFSANIVALLQTPSDAIQSLNDLNESPLEIGVQHTAYNKVFFNESTDPVTSRLYQKKMASKGENVYMEPVVGMELMRTSLFAYQVELQAGYQIISDTFREPEKCGLKELQPFQLPMFAIPTRKNFGYKELFRRNLRLQREIGLFRHEELKWFPQKPKCEGGVGGFVSIGITECRYALAMYGCGMLLGVIAFIFEMSFKYFLIFCMATQHYSKDLLTDYKK